jgi:hypothetical protein
MERTVKKSLVASAATVLLATTLVLGMGSTAQAATTSHVSFAISGSHSLVTGTSVKFSVATAKGDKGASVALQKLSGKSWTTITTTAIGSTGKGSKTIRVSGLGTVKYRAILKAHKSYTKATSRTIPLAMKAWFALAHLNYISDDSIDTGGYQVAGTRYATSVALEPWYHPSNVTYNLSYKCSQFAATVGQSDENTDGPTSIAEVEVDGANVGSWTQGIGQSTAVKINVTGGFRIKLDGSFSTTDGESYGNDVVFGNARILCSAHP